MPIPPWGDGPWEFAPLPDMTALEAACLAWVWAHTDRDAYTRRTIYRWGWLEHYAGPAVWRHFHDPRFKERQW